MPAETGHAHPVVSLAGQQTEATRGIRGIVQKGRARGETERLEIGLGQLTEVATPVQHRRDAVRQIEDERHSGRAQMGDSGGGGMHVVLRRRII